MQGTIRTIARRPLQLLLLGALLVAALTPAASSAAVAPPVDISGVRSWGLPERTFGDSITVSRAGTVWFGTPGLFALGRLEWIRLEIVSLAPSGDLEDSRKMGSTESVRSAPHGDLWFLRSHDGQQALLRRDARGRLHGFHLPGRLWISAFTPDRAGGVWFTRGSRKATRIGMMTAAGKVTEQPLAAGSGPASIIAGPDGNYWFTEKLAGKIGRISPSGKVHLFDLPQGAHPRRIVAGPDGALWFAEDRKLRNGETRIGRITTGGAISEFQVPFGAGIVDLAPDPRGVIWFTTQKGELSSISTDGEVGPRGCYGECSTPIEKVAVSPEGAVWFVTGPEPYECGGCGGGAALMAQNRGGYIGEIPSGRLQPAGGEQ
jgi:streptogramin lyase